jgi:ribonuclease HI
MREISLYTDGACSGNPGPGGWCAILVFGQKELELSGGLSETTNNQMELQAVISGLSALKERCRVQVFSDSKYVVQAFNDNWIAGWKKRGWKNAKGDPVANRSFWEELISVASKHEITWNWVKGHDGHDYNERCDELAVVARDSYKRG